MKPLLERIEKGEIDPSFVISHRMNLDEAARRHEDRDALLIESYCLSFSM